MNVDQAEEVRTEQADDAPADDRLADDELPDDEYPDDAPIDDAPTELDEELREALITRCELIPEQVALADAEMFTERVGFCEAALRLGLVTEDEAAAALEWARRLITSRQATLLEAALRKQITSRAVVVQRVAKAKPAACLILKNNPDDPRSERIRALRTELLLLDDWTTHGNALALLSPGAGEGRSLLAAELAIAFSQLGRRTLLVDADLRRPRQHELFCAENERGLAQALALREPPQLLDVEGLPNLSLLTSGPLMPNPLELISDSAFQQLVSDWRSDFAYVILDTPPLTRFSDGLAIATLTARAMVVSRANSTPHGAMKDMLRRLANTRSNILGAVINNF